MSRFLGALNVQYLGKMKDRAQWKLLEPFGFYSDKYNVKVRVPRGFITDFASVPRLPLTYLLAGGTGQKAAVIHDYLYRKARVTRKVADAIFYEALGVMQVPTWRRYLMWLAVRIGGTGSWKDE